MQITISIPEGGECLLKAGQIVDFDTPYLKINTTTQVAIPIAKKLRVPPEKIFRHLNKFVGEEVSNGEVIAQKKKIFITERVLSEFDGIIQEIDHQQGLLLLTRINEQKHTQPSIVRGIVEEVKQTEFLIKVEDVHEFPLKRTTESFGGETVYLKNISNYMPLSAKDLSDKIIVAESLSSFLQTKAEALGIKGFLTLIKLPQATHLPHAHIKQFDGLKTIMELNYPYSVIDKKYNKMYVYR